LVDIGEPFSTTFASQIQSDIEKIEDRSKLCLVVEWSLGEIEEYHLLKDFDPETLCMITPVDNLVTDKVWISRNIVLSFDYP
jgi:hypothetical protein